jgi:Na+-translocating ferredoxin:NAD+ oxidoreductase RNF subunit RnfB
MGPVWLSLRAELRLRWRVLAALAVLLGVIGGVVLTAAAGARRTDIDTAAEKIAHVLAPQSDPGMMGIRRQAGA